MQQRLIKILTPEIVQPPPLQDKGPCSTAPHKPMNVCLAENQMHTTRNGGLNSSSDNLGALRTRTFYQGILSTRQYEAQKAV